jgi:hypothetical protein
VLHSFFNASEAVLEAITSECDRRRHRLGRSPQGEDLHGNNRGNWIIVSKLGPTSWTSRAIWTNPAMHKAPGAFSSSLLPTLTAFCCSPIPRPFTTQD